MNEQKINELWHHLHWLSVLAQQGSYTAAAARLGVSKAAMSQRIAELERAARVPGPSILDPYLEYLTQRHAAGCENACTSASVAITAKGRPAAKACKAAAVAI